MEHELGRELINVTVTQQGYTYWASLVLASDDDVLICCDRVGYGAQVGYRTVAVAGRAERSVRSIQRAARFESTNYCLHRLITGWCVSIASKTNTVLSEPENTSN
jgi:hypothetical protein